MDIEELMVLEAIRLSLMEGQQQAESETGTTLVRACLTCLLTS